MIWQKCFKSDADGTDQMGSCRGPAAYANIYGYRPTPGLIAADRTYQNFDIPILTTPGCFAKTPNDMTFLIDAITGSNPLDKISFDLDSSFRNAKFSEKEFSNLKIGWLSNMNGKYNIEKSILDICEKKLKDLDIYGKTLIIFTSGTGRGSGAGSLVAYCLDITELDPIEHDLLFERFINPERISMPDFDIDFCQDRRDEVINYIKNRYGHENVAQIITFGSLHSGYSFC